MKVDWIFVFSGAAHNLMRLPRLIAHQQRKASSSRAPKTPVEPSKGALPPYLPCKIIPGKRPSQPNTT